MTTALYTPNGTEVEVIQDGEEMAMVKFPGGKVIWVKSGDLDFDAVTDDWDPSLDSPTDFDEHVMNEDDCADPVDQHDMEYDR